jgi:hypothetical protein
MVFHRVKIKATCATIVVAACVFLVGCQRGRADVYGVVSYQGKPIPFGTITFFDRDGIPVATASIRDGDYAVSQAPVGSLGVAVVVPPTSSTPPPKDLSAEERTHFRYVASLPLPAKYGDPAQSGLSLELEPGQQDHNFDLR